MIGLSLGLCVADIASGYVDELDVEKIIANTCAYNDERIDKLIAGYNEGYWFDLPQAESIARRLFAQGKVEQPRADDKPHPGYEAANYRNYWIKE